MSERLPDLLLAQLAEFVSTQMGLHFPRARWRDLERGLRSAAGDFGFADAAACARWLLSSPLTRTQIGILARHMTVGETYFFREAKSLAALEQTILPALIQARRGSEPHLRIWSAGCCTGEEPYSIAILLSRLIPDWRDWQIRILATDINPHFLRKAAEGVYGEWSFRGTPVWIKERYFRRTGAGRFQVVPWIRKMVTFSYLNLAEAVYPSPLNNTHAIDVILCCNVLMYFAPARAARVAQHLHNALVAGGWLIVGPVEASRPLLSQFEPVNFPGAILFQKATCQPSQADAAAPCTAPTRQPHEETQARIQPPGLPAGDAGSQAAGQPHEEAQDPIPQGVAPQPASYTEALALYEQGRYSEAAQKALELLSAAPGEARAITLLARIYANQGRWDEALAWSNRAVAADRLNPANHYLCAIIQEEQGRVDAAEASLKRALYLDQDFVLAHFALGNLARRQGRRREAARHFENTLALLNTCGQEDLLPESAGLTAGRLAKIVQALRQTI